MRAEVAAAQLPFEILEAFAINEASTCRSSALLLQELKICFEIGGLIIGDLLLGTGHIDACVEVVRLSVCFTGDPLAIHDFDELSHPVVDRVGAVAFHLEEVPMTQNEGLLFTDLTLVALPVQLLLNQWLIAERAFNAALLLVE